MFYIQPYTDKCEAIPKATYTNNDLEYAEKWFETSGRPDDDVMEKSNKPC